MKTGRKRTLLNVREHLEHCELIFEAFKKYGDCPAVREEIAKASLIGRGIMRKQDWEEAIKMDKANFPRQGFTRANGDRVEFDIPE